MGQDFGQKLRQLEEAHRARVKSDADIREAFNTAWRNAIEDVIKPALKDAPRPLLGTLYISLLTGNPDAVTIQLDEGADAPLAEFTYRADRLACRVMVETPYPELVAARYKVEDLTAEQVQRDAYNFLARALGIA
jgi:hypothetical protein